MNFKLLNECKAEAAERLSRLKLLCESPKDWCDGYAAALYAERSKPEQPKVLTDEEIERLRKDYRAADNSMAPEIKCIGFRDGLRHARDNGYLAPAAGLTVDDAEQLVKEWCFEWCERVAPYEDDWTDLRARLTAALNAKQQ